MELRDSRGSSTTAPTKLWIRSVSLSSRQRVMELDLHASFAVRKSDAPMVVSSLLRPIIIHDWAGSRILHKGFFFFFG